MAARPALDTAARSLTLIPMVKELLALRHRFRDSSSYWERRYRQGGTSAESREARRGVFTGQINKLELAQHIANHESPRTTKLYDRRQNEISLDEIERIAI